LVTRNEPTTTRNEEVETVQEVEAAVETVQVEAAVLPLGSGISSFRFD
jgi:hypothetical protein